MTDYKILLKILENRVFRELGNDITCGVCLSELFAGKISTNQKYFRLTMYSKEGCPYHTLLGRIRQLAIREEIYLQFKYRTQVVRLVMNLLFEEIDHTSDFDYLYESLYEFCNNPFTKIDENILLYCPNIMLSSDEIHELRLKNASVFPQIKDLNATFQQVCVDDYFSVKQVNSLADAYVYCDFCKMLTILSIVYAIERGI